MEMWWRRTFLRQHQHASQLVSPRIEPPQQYTYLSIPDHYLAAVKKSPRSPRPDIWNALRSRVFQSQYSKCSSPLKSAWFLRLQYSDIIRWGAETAPRSIYLGSSCRYALKTECWWGCICTCICAQHPCMHTASSAAVHVLLWFGAYSEDFCHIIKIPSFLSLAYIADCIRCSICRVSRFARLQNFKGE